MTSLALSFNEVNFSPVEQDGQPYLTSTELATALGYADTRSVTKIFNRYVDEFTASMSLVVKLTTKGFGNGNSEKETRIFSLRGCHLIAMFSKTAIAKQFRKWVLDILDREVLSQQIDLKQTISPEQAGILYNIVHTRAKGNGGTIASMWSRLKNHFKYSASYRELRAIHFEDAKHYLEVMEIKTKVTEVAVVEVKTENNDLKDSYFLHAFQAHEFDTRLRSLFDIANLFRKQSEEMNGFLAKVRP